MSACVPRPLLELATPRDLNGLGVTEARRCLDRLDRNGIGNFLPQRTAFAFLAVHQSFLQPSSTMFRPMRVRR